jgi:hypothetical protein
VQRWLVQMRKDVETDQAPASRQVYDLWEFDRARGGSAYFGRMPPQVVENLLWLHTESPVTQSSGRHARPDCWERQRLARPVLTTILGSVPSAIPCQT